MSDAPPGSPRSDFFDRSGDWRQRLALVTQIVRDLSVQQDPQEMLLAYSTRIRRLVPVDRTLSLSRRGLAWPRYRITRSDLWGDDLNPWTQRDLLPVLEGGLLADLLYGDQPRILDDVAEVVSRPDEPAAEHLEGMRSLAAIPHFDDEIGLNMVIHMRREPAAFSPEAFPEFALLSGLFGRAVHNLVLSAELRAAEESIKSQYHAMAELSDTVLQQALELKEYANKLEARVDRRTGELREANARLHQAISHLNEANLDSIYMLAIASEAKDQDTGRHVRRIQRYARLLARELGLDESDASALGYSAVLHDVGKMHVPDHILKKPGPLTPDERREMQEHTVVGERIICDKPFFAPARRIARSHHENWDGSGYPDRLAGRQVPLEARIVHLADVYDALTSPRVYKRAWSGYDAAQVLLESSGRMFDPEVVAAFSSLARRGALSTNGDEADNAEVVAPADSPCKP